MTLAFCHGSGESGPSHIAFKKIRVLILKILSLYLNRSIFNYKLTRSVISASQKCSI